MVFSIPVGSGLNKNQTVEAESVIEKEDDRGKEGGFVVNNSIAKKGFLETKYFGFIQAKYYLIFLFILIAGILLNATPGGFLGGFVICTLFGLLLEEVGNNLPIIKEYFGGGPFVTIFIGAMLAYWKIFPEKVTNSIVDFIKPMDYIGLAVAALICGSILTMDRKVLVKAGSRYLFPLIAGIIAAFGLTGIVGQILGYGWREAILFIALPIMGGGTSAGAVPTAQIYSATLSFDNSYYLSILMPAVALGNALSIVFAGLLNKVGEKFPSTTGKGMILKGYTLQKEEVAKEPVNYQYMGTGFVITGVFFTVGIIISKFVPAIHYYAWTIISVAIAKITGVFPKQLEKQIAQWYDFVLKVTLPAVLFGIGFVYTDLSVVLQSLSIKYLVMIFTTVLGAVLGAWFVGKLVGFYPLESAVTAGLCMSNMGGTGDVATLGAARRMELMPFAQISSRIGGAIILVIASILS
ncbi:MAG: 2-hydroxycarboxylate transporter family protein, partial [Firmicutes bacterium]|nr:2-hydroxycarboxylate transporter family protein [Bacillota bacterium]